VELKKAFKRAQTNVEVAVKEGDVEEVVVEELAVEEGDVEEVAVERGEDAAVVQQAQGVLGAEIAHILAPQSVTFLARVSPFVFAHSQWVPALRLGP